MHYGFVLVLVISLSFFQFFSPVFGNPERGSFFFFFFKVQLYTLRGGKKLKTHTSKETRTKDLLFICH